MFLHKYPNYSRIMFKWLWQSVNCQNSEKRINEKIWVRWYNFFFYSGCLTYIYVTFNAFLQARQVINKYWEFYINLTGKNIMVTKINMYEYFNTKMISFTLVINDKISIYFELFKTLCLLWKNNILRSLLLCELRK